MHYDLRPLRYSSKRNLHCHNYLRGEPPEVLYQRPRLRSWYGGRLIREIDWRRGMGITTSRLVSAMAIWFARWVGARVAGRRELGRWITR